MKSFNTRKETKTKSRNFQETMKELESMPKEQFEKDSRYIPLAKILTEIFEETKEK